MQITEQNIEELILLYIDGELEPAVAEGVVEYIRQHPQYAALLENYQQMILIPDTQLFYNNKEGLLQPVSKPILLTRKRWFAVAAAAAMLLCSVLAINFLKDAPAITDKGRIAKSHNRPAQIAPNTIPVVPSGTITTWKQPVNANNTTLYRKSNKLLIRKHEDATASIPDKSRLLQQDVTPLPSQSIKRMEQHIELNAGLASGIPSVNVPNDDLPDNSKLPEWLPVEPERLEAVNELVAQFKEVKERLQEGGRTLKNASFALRIGDKEIGFGKKNHN